MSAADLASRMRHGFPRESVSDSAYRTELEYVGLASDLRSNSPETYSTWGSYYGIVIDSRLDPLEGTDWAILTVIVELKFEGGEATFGEKQQTTTEVDWQDVQRSLYEHPDFSIDGSGAYKLTSEDIAAIDKWKLMSRVDYKKEYIYYIDETETETETLSSRAKMFARGIQLGIEYWVDKAPLARKIETYVGGPGPTSSAGAKETPTGIPGLPSGYEWLRNADRNVKKGGEGRWERTMEWIGAKKVLIDKNEIYWSAP